MEAQYKIDFITGISQVEAVEILHSIVNSGGTGWLSEVLRRYKVNGRTKIVDSFRYAQNWKYVNGQYKTVTIPGRTPQDQDESVIKLLDEAPLEQWLDIYVRDHSLSHASWCIRNGLCKAGGNSNKFKYNIEVELN